MMTPEQHDAIERDKEFWRTYADHTAKELLRSNGALTARLADLARELAALGPWTVKDLRQYLRQYVADTSDGFECETGCDSYGHTEFCPVTNTVAAFRLLRERLVVWECGCSWVNGANLAVCAQCGRTPAEGSGQAPSRELERALSDAQSENAVLREAAAEAWSAHGETLKIIERQAEWIAAKETLACALAERDERIRELEQQLEQSRQTLCGEIETLIDEKNNLEQQLKAAQERLAEAEALLRNAKEADTLSHLEEIMNQAEEYFAKHSPEKTERG